MKLDNGSPQIGSAPRRFGPALALFALVALAYAPALRSGFIWDDDDYVTENKTLRSADGLRRIWFEPTATPQYYPLVHTTFWIEYHLWGLSPAGYHLINVLLHAASALLVWLILRSLGIPGAWLAAAVFGLHPVHVESVAWITERKNVLSGQFYLLSLLVYLDVARLEVSATTDARRTGRYFAATLLFVAALLSKSVTCSLPAAILLLIAWKRRRIAVSDVLPLAPWFLIGLAAALGTAALEHSHVGASGTPFAWSFGERCLIAAHALCFYLGKLVWPHPLSFIYPHWKVSLTDPRQWVYVGAVVGAFALLIASRPRWGSGPLTAALFFAGTLLPALGFINIYPLRYSFVADHFQYLASLGPITLAAAVVTELSRRHGATLPVNWRFLVERGLAVCLLGGLALATWNRQNAYRDSEALWTDVLAKNPRAGIAHFHLGKIRTAQGRTDSAIQHFRAALAHQTDATELHIIQTLLGNSLVRAGEFSEAQESFGAALRHDPNSWEALNGLANLFARQGQAGQAIELYRRALAVAPEQAALHQNLANALAVTGALDEAETQYRESIRLDPQSATAHLNLGSLLARQERFAQAEQELQAALRLDPGLEPARVNLARVRAEHKGK